MKRLFFSMTVLLAILLAEQDAVADVLFPPYNNSVAVWLLDEGSGTSFYDATINNNNGAFVRTGTDVSFDTTVKKFGASSFKEFNAFSGEGGIVPDSASLHALTNNFTVESWIRWDGVSANGTMMSRADSTRTSAYQWEIVQNGTTKDLVLAINSAAGTILVDDGAPFPSNVFVHVAFTYASGAVNLYTNGFLAGSASNPSVVPSGIGKIALGTFIDGSGGVGPSFRDGWLDEVRLSDIVRVPGDGSGTNNFLAWNQSLIPEPTALNLSLLSLAWVFLPVSRRLKSRREK